MRHIYSALESGSAVNSACDELDQMNHETTVDLVINKLPKLRPCFRAVHVKMGSQAVIAWFHSLAIILIACKHDRELQDEFLVAAPALDNDVWIASEASKIMELGHAYYEKTESIAVTCLHRFMMTYESFGASALGGHAQSAKQGLFTALELLRRAYLQMAAMNKLFIILNDSKKIMNAIQESGSTIFILAHDYISKNHLRIDECMNAVVTKHGKLSGAGTSLFFAMVILIASGDVEASDSLQVVNQKLKDPAWTRSQCANILVTGDLYYSEAQDFLVTNLSGLNTLMEGLSGGGGPEGYQAMKKGLLIGFALLYEAVSKS